MQINPTSTLAFGTDTLRVAHLSWGSTLLTLIQSSTPTVEGTTELWIRGYAFNTRSRVWEELDAHGPVISLPAVDTGDISAWTMGEPVLVGSSSPSSGNVESASAQAVNRPASTRSKAARAHAMSLMLGTSTGKLMHIAVQFASNSVSWNQVELSHPITPLAPSGVVHLAMHPGGCFISAVDTLGRVAIVDLVGKPVSVRHAFTSSPTSSSLADPIHPLQTLGFNAPPLLASWTPAPPHSSLTATAPLPGQRVYVPTAVPTSTPSTLLLVFDRGPFAALTFDFASTSTSLIGYARHLLARGQIGWMHVMHLAKHLPLHSPRDIATLGHMLLNSIPTPAQGQHDPMFDSGAYHAQLARIATRVLEAYPAHASATSLARKLVHAHLAHGRLDSALSTAAGMAGVCSDLLHLIALCASQHANARGLAAAAHFQFLKTCPGPYPPLLVADPTPMPPDDGDGVPTVDELVDMYTRQVAPIAAGTKPAFGAHVRRLAAYLEVSGNREEALRWWRRVGYEEEGRRGADRVASVLGWWDSKRRGEGEGR
ncbi:hypothetical protein BCR44DRAFT_251151 [Catenaria anguillulae PL171]|uniref:Uncharacterized protein n=1 Tax=Catenaria anguillulae PL171 TaxID=765915 RepID=A0A1Y2HNM1_9FUNG|nr:hypothetical protein BCR44DRAFT_251151 [Catenaria anguillulae PL171]